MTRILVPLDTSDVAAKALDDAVTLARALDAEVVLLTVLDLVVHNALDPMMDSERITAERAAQTYQGRVVTQLVDKGIQAEGLVVDGKDPAAAIVDTAEHQKVDMIVMCTHGRSGPARWLLGSVTERVIRASTVPVHICPVRSIKEQ